MKRRLRRMGWSLRRLRVDRLVAAAVLAATAVGALRLVGDVDLSLLGRGAALIAIGILLARPAAALWSRFMVRRPPWRAAPELRFAGADLGFQMAGDAGPNTYRDMRAAIAGELARATNPIALEVWLVASDEAGRDSTIVESLPDRRLWSSSLEGALDLADLDNLFGAGLRLVTEQWEVPITRFDVLAWGNERTQDGSRQVLVASARTSMPAERLVALTDDDSAGRTSHPVSLSVECVADALAWGDPASWRGGALYGLLELLEQAEPGSWTALEARVRARWRDKAMFARVERGTAQITGRVLAADG